MIRFQNENRNSAGNFNSVEIKGVKFWFSYETVVAVRLANVFEEKYFWVRENERGPTTGKHLNWISEKSDRVSADKFEEVLQEAYRQIGM